MKQTIKRWLLGIGVAIAFIFSIQTQPAFAKAINYQALVYGTNKTSMASGYYVRPASVVVKNHKYVVTMRIKTAKKLSSFPVKVISVNGAKPKNVRKVKDSAGNSNLYYSFVTTNLKKRINEKLTVNIPKVYKATHMITFKFSTAGLPSLTSKSHAVAATRAASTTKTSTSTKKATANSTAATSEPNESRLKAIKAKDDSSKQAASAAAATSSNSKASSASSSSSSSSAVVSSTPQKKATATSEDKKDHSQTKSKLPVLISGIVAIIVIVGGGALWLAGGRGRHSRGD